MECKSNFLIALGVTLSVLVCLACRAGVPSETASEAMTGKHPNRQSGSSTTDVQGTVLHQSDIGTIPDQTYSSGYLVVIAEEVFVGGKPQPSKETDIPAGPIAPEFLESTNSLIVPLGKDGAFSLHLEPGVYRICPPDLGENPLPTTPTYIYGCVQISISEPMDIFLELRFGEGGLTHQMSKK